MTIANLKKYLDDHPELLCENGGTIYKDLAISVAKELSMIEYGNNEMIDLQIAGKVLGSGDLAGNFWAEAMIDPAHKEILRDYLRSKGFQI